MIGAVPEWWFTAEIRRIPSVRDEVASGSRSGRQRCLLVSGTVATLAGLALVAPVENVFVLVGAGLPLLVVNHFVMYGALLVPDTARHLAVLIAGFVATTVGFVLWLG